MSEKNILVKNSSFEININNRQANILSELSNVVKIFQNELQNDKIIYIPDYIKKESMLLIIDFCDMYNDTVGEIIKPITENKFQDWVGEEIYIWFLLLKRKQLFDLLNNANCLCMDELIEIICVRLALNIKEMTMDNLIEYLQCSN